jgi:hypothetical protein
MDTILRSKVLEEIDSFEPVSLEIITADRRRGTGGKWISLENWVKVRSEDAPAIGHAGNAPSKNISKKDPGHYQHGTINMENPGNKALHIVKVHIPLIQTFNGKKVING